MSLNSEIIRLQNAKSTLKTKLNARNDNQHQIDDETIDEYGDFVDSIPQGGGIDWNEIGYSTEPDVFSDAFDYAKNIYDNWDSTETILSNKFKNDNDLVFMPFVNTQNATRFDSMFYGCQRLIYVPQLNTSNGTRFDLMFKDCVGLKSIPQLNTANATNFYGVFQGCVNLTTIPQLNTSNGTSFSYTFYQCKKITTIPQLNTANATDFSYMFSSCSSLTSVPELNASRVTNLNNMFSNVTHHLTFTLEGFTNIGQAYTTTTSANNLYYTIPIQNLNLTHDSLMNVINKLYDIATKGCNTQKLSIGSTNLAKLTAEEISTATNKGWSVS